MRDIETRITFAIAGTLNEEVREELVTGIGLILRAVVGGRDTSDIEFDTIVGGKEGV